MSGNRARRRIDSAVILPRRRRRTLDLWDHVKAARAGTYHRAYAPLALDGRVPDVAVVSRLDMRLAYWPLVWSHPNAARPRCSVRGCDGRALYAIRFLMRRRNGHESTRSSNRCTQHTRLWAIANSMAPPAPRPA